jgi:hypothetical protein
MTLRGIAELALAAAVGTLMVGKAHAIAYTFTTIDVPGASSTSAAGIDDAGQITGSYDDSTGTHAFLRTAQIRVIRGVRFAGLRRASPTLPTASSIPSVRPRPGQRSRRSSRAGPRRS